MALTHSVGPASVATDSEARKIVGTGERDGRSFRPDPNRPQVIRADLVGSNTCSAAGIVATGNAPVLSLCRRLVAAGHPPGTRLEVYRGNTLALRARSIGEAAKLTVRESTRDGRPRFVRLRSSDVGPPVRKSSPPLTEGWTDWPAATDGGGQ
jgi:hypothetical protein